MELLSTFAADLVAISILCFALYYPRHRRRELLVAFLGVNAGVLAVTTALVASDTTLGLGLGLFGVLSIIRLRSLELGQHEVAYYFAALALGLLGGLGSLTVTLTAILMAVIVAVLAIADSPRTFPRDEQQMVLLDGAYADRASLAAALAEVVPGEVRRTVVQRVDLVNDTTLVDVRWTRTDEPRRGDHGSAERTGAEVLA
ncbi:DUF4956 domain-containing protein [Nocardioides panacisoli]|uniref:DUF4956 domain-containing protein n=1 Tax=Nocardioides panacisoli TaxID=627624 RepID=UPI001C63A1F2|nr:DUF4956 domain-containing protein [Nocardioides panacisoli]QYJ03350.1 DUF4956 domain-containing protein [Nocardioides panacisoli]